MSLSHASSFIFLTEKKSIPQLSFEPSSNVSANTVAVPSVVIATCVISSHTGVGVMSSTTDTVTVTSDVLPHPSSAT